MPATKAVRASSCRLHARKDDATIGPPGGRQRLAGPLIGTRLLAGQGEDGAPGSCADAHCTDAQCTLHICTLHRCAASGCARASSRALTDVQLPGAPARVPKRSLKVTPGWSSRLCVAPKVSVFLSDGHGPREFEMRMARGHRSVAASCRKVPAPAMGCVEFTPLVHRSGRLGQSTDLTEVFFPRIRAYRTLLGDPGEPRSEVSNASGYLLIKSLSMRPPTTLGSKSG
jgi:hypothetical protein